MPGTCVLRASGSHPGRCGQRRRGERTRKGWLGLGCLGSGGQAGMQESLKALGSGEVWSATLPRTRAAINLKPLGILLAFSKYY